MTIVSRYCIAIGVNAMHNYAGTADFIVALGDDVVVPDDSPPNMLYIAGEAPRALPVIDAEVGELIKRHAREIIESQERMGGDYSASRAQMTDAFWDKYFSEWNAETTASRA